MAERREFPAVPNKLNFEQRREVERILAMEEDALCMRLYEFYSDHNGLSRMAVDQQAAIRSLERANDTLVRFLVRWLGIAEGTDQEFTDDTDAMAALATEIGEVLKPYETILPPAEGQATP